MLITTSGGMILPGKDVRIERKCGDRTATAKVQEATMRQLGGEIFRSVHPRSDKRPEYDCIFYCSTQCSPFRKQTSTFPVTMTVTVRHYGLYYYVLDAEYRRDFSAGTTR